MRLLSLLLFFKLFAFSSFADEGMWLPLLLEKYNIQDMQNKGLKLSAEDIYSVNQACLKDAVVLFGGGCTGELISDQGLLLTNHHCGFSSIQSHSSLENNYLKDGFWAMNRKEELPSSGLTASFLMKMEDVTAKVLVGVEQTTSEEERFQVIYENIKNIEKEAREGTNYEASVESFYYGNEYYLFVSKTYTDLRLVGAPPSSIGKFGGDTDNWMWPRHTGDFSLFRIYANAENEPSDYSPDNVPYQPKHHFPISLKGAKEGDFTMIFGYPGRTDQFLTSFAVDQIQNMANPLAIKSRDIRLAAMQKEMDKDEQVWLNYAPKQASISNYYKKFKGENRGLKKLEAIAQKQKLEKQFQLWANENELRKAQYGGILTAYEEIYSELEQYQKVRTLLNEAAFGPEIMNYAYRFEDLIRKSKADYYEEKDIKAVAERKLKGSKGRFNKYHLAIDREVFPKLIELYFTEISTDLLPPIYEEINKKYKGNYEKYGAYVFSKSLFADREKLQKFLANYEAKDVKKLEKDPAYKLMSGILGDYRANINPKVRELEEKLDYLNRVYVRGLREMQTDKVFYPDANSTLRLSYGKVEGYSPEEGKTYTPFTTLSSMMDLYKPDDSEFDLPAKLLKLYEEKNYGEYAVNGDVPVCFIASNHTTGGNSGSPIINGEGQLIGTNFDRNWEGTMSDIMYDIDQCRNISVDIRYTLFIIDKFAGAKHLIEEMTIAK